MAEADPDINMPYVFMLGNEMSKKWGQKQRVGKVRFLPARHKCVPVPVE